MTDVREYDYVIAGAGSAGCTLAARLCEDPDVTVCLVEAGGNGRSLFTRMPAGNGFLFGNPKFDWGLESIPQPALNGRKIYYPRGKGLGGSSLMNGMIYIRGTADDYDRWRQKGLAGWSYADVLPYFKRSSGAAHRKSDPFHSADGPLKLTPAGNYDLLNELFVAAAQQAGNPHNADFNGTHQRGVGQIDVKVWQGRRQSTREAYLSHQPANLTIKTDARVIGIDREDRCAVGLKLTNGRIRAEREVVLCLGAFGSPHILMLSGIGPADHLREYGIPVWHDLPGVGSRLYDHPQMPMKFALVNPDLSMSRFQRVDRAIAMGAQYLISRSGPGAAPFWSSVIFHSLRDNDNPELEIYMTPMCVKEQAAPWEWTIENILNIGNLIMTRGKTAVPGLQIEVNINRPHSFGTVRLSSPDPLQSPKIDPNWFTDPSDMADVVAGMKHVRDIISQPAFEGVIGDEMLPGKIASTDEELEAAVRDGVQTGHHPVSSCRMGGEHDPGAVLDEQLRVRGIDGLRVVDASAFPDHIGGNINAPIIMLAEKAADLILGRPPLPPEDPRIQLQ